MEKFFRRIFFSRALFNEYANAAHFCVVAMGKYLQIALFNSLLYIHAPLVN